MQFITLAACFFLLCFGHHHRPVHHHAVQHHVVRHYHATPAAPVVAAPKPDPVDPILRPTGSCEIIGGAYDDFFYSAANGFGSRTDNNRDRFVARYPADEQRKVITCLEKTGRGD